MARTVSVGRSISRITIYLRQAYFPSRLLSRLGLSAATGLGPKVESLSTWLRCDESVVHMVLSFYKEDEENHKMLRRNCGRKRVVQAWTIYCWVSATTHSFSWLSTLTQILG